MPELLISRNFQIPDAYKFKSARKLGAYGSLEKLFKMEPSAVIEEVKKSNLRGHGGAGFPAGMKWSFVPPPEKLDKLRFLCVNADEGEPGTFKDRHILELDPHMLLEGIIICCYAVKIPRAYVYIRGEFFQGKKRLDAAIKEAYENGLLGKNIQGSGFDLDVYTTVGAGAYICGEETALLNSLEGKKGWPRLKPPFPAVVGLYGGPTVVNNVETLSYLPSIIRNGGEWFAKLGVERNGGHKLFAVSGHVNKPGVYELPLGSTMRQLIYDYAGGVRSDKAIKCIIPGGSSAPPIGPDEIDVQLTFDSMMQIGTMLGSGAVIVMDEDTDLSEVLMVLSRFYAHESCGQCVPCREGTRWMYHICKRIYEGNGKPSDLDLLVDISNNIEGRTICPLGAAAAMPIRGYATKFRQELENKIKRLKY